VPDPNDLLELPEVLIELRRAYGVNATYATLWGRIMAGKVPAERAGKRWRVKRSDMPEVAKAMAAGTPAAPTPRPRPRPQLDTDLPPAA
jgi:hypothetical protein